MGPLALVGRERQIARREHVRGHLRERIGAQTVAP
jgi:hypothetical protein